ENWLPEERLNATDTELERQGLYEILRSNGIQVHVARQRIGARRATREEGSLLAQRTNEPLLSMQRTAYDDQHIVIEYGTHVYVPASYSFEVTLTTGGNE